MRCRRIRRTHADTTRLPSPGVPKATTTCRARTPRRGPRTATRRRRPATAGRRRSSLAHSSGLAISLLGFAVERGARTRDPKMGKVLGTPGRADPDAPWLPGKSSRRPGIRFRESAMHPRDALGNRRNPPSYRPEWRAWVEANEPHASESAATFQSMVQAGRVMIRSLAGGRRRDYVRAYERFHRLARGAVDRSHLSRAALATAIRREASRWGYRRHPCWIATVGDSPNSDCQELPLGRRSPRLTPGAGIDDRAAAPGGAARTRPRQPLDRTIRPERRQRAAIHSVNRLCRPVDRRHRLRTWFVTRKRQLKRWHTSVVGPSPVHRLARRSSGAR
jgi:hypothetical protein